MAAEAGHHPNRIYVDQDGDLHLNGAALFDENEVDLAAGLSDKNVEPSDQSTITLNAGGSVTQTATVALKDANGNTLTGVHVLELYMCTDANGATPSTSGAEVSAAPTTGAAITTHTAKLHWVAATNTSGSLVLTFDNTGGGGAYTDRVALVLPGGKVVVSDALNVGTA